MMEGVSISVIEQFVDDGGDLLRRGAHEDVEDGVLFRVGHESRSRHWPGSSRAR